MKYNELELKQVQSKRDISKFLNKLRRPYGYPTYILIEGRFSDNPCMYNKNDDFYPYNGDLNGYSIGMKFITSNNCYVCWWKSEDGIRYLSIEDMAKEIFEMIKKEYNF